MRSDEVTDALNRLNQEVEIHPDQILRDIVIVLNYLVEERPCQCIRCVMP